MGEQYVIKPTTDVKLITDVMTEEKLFMASMPDEDIKALQEGSWKPTKQCTYLAFYKDDNPIGVIRCYPVSNITVDVHVHLNSKYWGTGASTELDKKLAKWLTDNTTYCKIMVQTPQCCTHVLKAASLHGYELEGVLSSAICWRGQIENIAIMSKFIRG